LLEELPATAVLYRPVGPKELALIRDSGFRQFPPRLPEQPIFYPVVHRAYAEQIARDWNAEQKESDYSGFVTEFAVDAEFLARYSIHQVGSAMHTEYWIPAGDLVAFNEHIRGPIRVVAEFHGGPQAAV
jgi:hypothetical protein